MRSSYSLDIDPIDYYYCIIAITSTELQYIEPDPKTKNLTTDFNK